MTARAFRLTFYSVVATTALAAGGARAQATNSETVPNPYTTVPGVFAQLPDGRQWGAVSAVDYAGKGKLWVAERCGDNTNCLNTPQIDPVLLIDTKTGKILRKFGKNMIVWPHGIHVDKDGNVWVTDARVDKERKKGNQVFKFSPRGKLLMTLGKAGETGNDEYTFSAPNDVLVLPNGDILVSDGHNDNSNNRVLKYDKKGKFIMQWGGTGSEPGQFKQPHALAIDSQGRLFIADRSNNRVQVFDQTGKFLFAWSQFGRPSGLYIDKNDTLYVADSESSTGPTRNPGWERGIRIGSAKTGVVTAFIPDPTKGEARGGTSVAEGVAADDDGNVFGGEVAQKMLRKYVPTKK